MLGWLLLISYDDLLAHIRNKAITRTETIFQYSEAREVSRTFSCSYNIGLASLEKNLTLGIDKYLG